MASRTSRLLLPLLVATAILLQPTMAAAQEQPTSPPSPSDGISVEVEETPAIPDIGITVESEDGGLSRAVSIILILFIASIVPLILLLTTSFTRFAVVLGLTRNAVGVQTIPPTQVLIGLAFVLTLFVMAPVLEVIKAEAVDPLLAGEIDQEEALEAAVKPLRGFMLSQTREEDLALFLSLSGEEKPENPQDIPTTTLIPAFVISELTTAFIIGFLVFVPFLVIDLIVSAVLMSLGMVMLPPVFISLPLKLLLFVLLDGWALLVGSVVESVGTVA